VARNRKGIDLLMSFKLELDNKSYPKDEVFFVPHFPAELKNGHQVTVDDDAVEEYEQLTGNKFEKVAEGIVGMKVSKVSSGKERGDS
jgi:hypothetical protein